MSNEFEQYLFGLFTHYVDFEKVAACLPILAATTMRIVAKVLLADFSLTLATDTCASKNARNSKILVVVLL